MDGIRDALIRSLPLAIGIAASPWAILAQMMVLISRRAIANALYYLLAWFSGLMGVGGAFLFIPGLDELSGPPSGLTGWFRIGMGLFFLLLAVLLAFRVPGQLNTKASGQWLERIERIGAGHALLAGFFLSAINLKNASMVVAATADIGYFGLDPSSEVTALALFSLVASAGVLLPLALFLAFRNAAEYFFGRLKGWLVAYRVHILLLVLLVSGTLMLTRGLRILRDIYLLVSESA